MLSCILHMASEYAESAALLISNSNSTQASASVFSYFMRAGHSEVTPVQQNTVPCAARSSKSYCLVKYCDSAKDIE